MSVFVSSALMAASLLYIAYGVVGTSIPMKPTSNPDCAHIEEKEEVTLLQVSQALKLGTREQARAQGQGHRQSDVLRDQEAAVFRYAELEGELRNQPQAAASPQAQAICQHLPACNGADWSEKDKDDCYWGCKSAHQALDDLSHTCGQKCNRLMNPGEPSYLARSYAPCFKGCEAGLTEWHSPQAQAICPHGHSPQACKGADWSEKDKHACYMGCKSAHQALDDLSHTCGQKCNQLVNPGEPSYLARSYAPCFKGCETGMTEWHFR